VEGDRGRPDLEETLLKGFKEFLLRGNLIDLAVAVVIGTAFFALVTSFTESFINPLLAAFGGDQEIGLGFTIRDGNEATFIDIGGFITAIITFLITAAVVYFFVVLPMKTIQERRARGVEPEPEAATEDILLLREIRDLLAGRGTRPSDTSESPESTETTGSTAPRSS
jgi:large conductance mechanosensitive channel